MKFPEQLIAAVEGVVVPLEDPEVKRIVRKVTSSWMARGWVTPRGFNARKHKPEPKDAPKDSWWAKPYESREAFNAGAAKAAERLAGTHGHIADTSRR